MADIIPIKRRELDDDEMLVTLRVSDLRALIRAEQSGIDMRLGPDRLIDIAEAAKILSVSEDHIYHNLKKFPFVVKRLGPRVLRFSFNGIQKWIASKG